MRVFLTGATGFVMGAVARTLRTRGDDVVALVRSSARGRDLSAIGCELVEGDVAQLGRGAADRLRACDALVHGAAIYEIGVSAARRRRSPPPRPHLDDRRLREHARPGRNGRT